MAEAALDEIVHERDPWGLLDGLRARARSGEIEPHQKQGYYQQFIALVALKPQAEQDALLNSAQNFFHFRTETARKDVSALRAAGAGVVRIAPCAIGDDLIAEVIHEPGSVPDVRYLVYKTATGEMEVADRVTIDGVVYLPPQSKLASMGVLLLPTAAEEYGTDADLLHDIESFVCRYLHLPTLDGPNGQPVPDPFYSIIADYTLLTWVYDRFDVVPYLRFIGEPATGKSTALDVVAAISFRTIRTSGSTTASPIFRLLDRWHCAFVLDEMDLGQSDMWADMVKILNVGYRRGYPVLRSERGSKDGQFDVESFDVFGPKVLATRRPFEDQALETRCLTHTMLRGEVPHTYPLMLDGEFRAAAATLRNKLLLWRFRRWHAATLDVYRRIPGLEKETRLNQILLPIMATVAPAQQGVIVEHATQYAAAIVRERSESFEGQVAREMLKRYGVTTKLERIDLKIVTDGLKQEYGTDGMGVKVTSRRIADVVRIAFGLRTSLGNGVTQIVLRPADAVRIAAMYGVEPEVWDADGRVARLANPPRRTRVPESALDDAPPRPVRTRVPEAALDAPEPTPRPRRTRVDPADLETDA